MDTHEDTPLALGLIGAGRIGQVHANALMSANARRRRQGRLVAVADLDERPRPGCYGLYGVPFVPVDEILNDPAIDAVFVCTPTPTHVELVERAVCALKPVFCEKPLGLDVNRIRQCLEVVDEQLGVLMVGFNRRFDPRIVEIRKLIALGTIGRVRMVTIVSRDPDAPPLSFLPDSGGLFHDLSIHDLDLARCLLDDEPTHVSARGSLQTDRRASPDIDQATITLMTDSGAMATIVNVRRDTHGPDLSVEVHGTEGTIRLDDIHASAVEILGGRPPVTTFLERYLDSFQAEVASFVDAVRDGIVYEGTGDDALRATMLADAATRSWQLSGVQLKV